MRNCPNCGNPEVRGARCDICGSFGSFYLFEILTLLTVAIAVGGGVIYYLNSMCGVAGEVLSASQTTPTADTVTVESEPIASISDSCLFYTETGGGEGGYFVCDDAEASFRTALEWWGVQKIGYPISRRYVHDGFVTQAFQKAIMQWQPSGRVALINIFDDLHNAGFDDILLSTRQTPRQLPIGWDGNISFDQVIKKRQALLDARPALRAVYFAFDDPLLFYGLPTSEVQDMGNHYAIRLQRTMLQEWKEDVPWARAGQVTIANGGDIAKELGIMPAEAVIPESTSPVSKIPSSPSPTLIEGFKRPILFLHNLVCKL